MKIRLSREADLPRMIEIYEHARAYMKEHGNPYQWGDNWPSEDLIRKDITMGKSYVCVDENERILATFYYDCGVDIEPTYAYIDDGNWGNDTAYGVVHRIASAGSNKGVGKFCIDWAYKQCGHLRIDTHEDNATMRHLLTSMGFRACGTIYVREGKEPRIAFEKYASMDQRLKEQMAFALEIDKEKNVLRQTHLSGHGRRENDSEHAWHMAIMAYLLKEYANEPVDIAKTMIMCLIHDIVEIDAGDTYAYDEEGLKTQKAREDAAKERIFSLLPADQKEELIALFDEFEAGESAEARFAKAMDNLQPLMLNDSNNGGDWKEHKAKKEKIYQRQKKTERGSRLLYEYTDHLLKKNIEKGNIEI